MSAKNIMENKSLFVAFIASDKLSAKFQSLSGGKDFKDKWMGYLESDECLKLWNEWLKEEKLAGRVQNYHVEEPRDA